MVALLQRGEVSLTRWLPYLPCRGEQAQSKQGDLQQKINSYLRPLYDALYEVIEPEKVANLMERGMIEVAPLAPSLVTPGFEKNQAYLNQPIKFQVRFVQGSGLNPQRWRGIPIPVSRNQGVVADRAFNGLKIAQAYLGSRAVESVKGDPENPNRQLTHP